MIFRKVRDAHNTRMRNYTDRDLVPEVKELMEKFKEKSIDQLEHFTWRLFNDYIAFTELGIHLKSQRAKIVEALIKFGKDSLYWEMVEDTKMLRKQQLIRVTYVAREIASMVKNKSFPTTLQRGDKNKLTFFLKTTVSLRKYLLAVPLSEAQMIQLWKTERILGIYYEDLTPEENGEIWRLEALKHVKKGKEDV